MKKYELGGSYREMGHQFGEALRRADRSLESAVPESLDPSPEKRQFIQECEAITREHLPELVDELDGIAEATGHDPESVRGVSLALDAEPGCAVVAVTGDATADGAKLLGRNYDFYPSFADYVKLYHSRPDGRLASVGCATVPVGRADGLNEAGLAVGHTGVDPHGYEPGVMWQLAVRGVLDRCRNVEDAVHFLQELPHATNTNFLLLDETGDVAIVEASPERTRATRPDEDVGAITNQFLSNAMVELQPHDRRPDDCERYQRIQEWFRDRDGNVTRSDLRELLSDPDAGVCCNDEHSNLGQRSTLWSWIVDVDEGTASVTNGSPAEAGYEHVPLQ